MTILGGVNMKRLFYQTKLYDYSTIKECIWHVEDMAKRGWKVNPETITVDEDGFRCPYFMNGQDEYPYSVEFYKEM